jgi:hypothetical protein
MAMMIANTRTPEKTLLHLPPLVPSCPEGGCTPARVSEGGVPSGAKEADAGERHSDERGSAAYNPGLGDGELRPGGPLKTVSMASRSQCAGNDRGLLQKNRRVDFAPAGPVAGTNEESSKNSSLSSGYRLKRNGAYAAQLQRSSRIVGKKEILSIHEIVRRDQEAGYWHKCRRMDRTRYSVLEKVISGAKKAKHNNNPAEDKKK